VPRALRVLIEGGLYHVYNGFARGEEVYADPSEAVEFVELLKGLKGRDDLQVFAWSLLSNSGYVARYIVVTWATTRMFRAACVFRRTWTPIPTKVDTSGSWDEGGPWLMECPR
jgi:hypothetical protein